jgi:adenylate cyclase
MFCDLRGFTKLNDTLGAEATVVLMNQVFEKVGDVLAQFPTEILKFIGDAMLILLPVEDFSSKAEMQEVMHSIAMESSEEINVLAKDLNKDLSLGFGGNIGEVYYGNVGTGTRLDFTVMGPAVNKAARLESLCSKLNSHYVVSSEAYFGEANFIDHGMQSLKGIEQRQQIYGLSFIAREPR